MLLATIISAHRCARIEAESLAWSDAECSPEEAES